MNDISSRTLEQLQLLAERLRDDPSYMASVFAKYIEFERISVLRMMEILGTSPINYSRIALCKRPSMESLDFAQQVIQIALFAQVDPGLLATIIRQVDSIQALSSNPLAKEQDERESLTNQLRTGLLAAARDRSDQDQDLDSNTNSGTKDEDVGGGDDMADK